jgi:predicted Zn-dependent protease
MRALCCCALAFLSVFSGPALNEQEKCPLPPAIVPLSPYVDMFSDQQEVDLGDVLAESIAQHIKIIDNDRLTAYLRTLGDRLVTHLPPTNLKFRFYLVELPNVNAFSIAGGRVYMSRKMVALTQNEDELAGVLAHELGHIVTHQTSIEITRRFRDNFRSDASWRPQ